MKHPLVLSSVFVIMWCAAVIPSSSEQTVPEQKMQDSNASHPKASNLSQSNGVANSKKTITSKHKSLIEKTNSHHKSAMKGTGLQPIVPVKGVHPVGELEVLKALKDPSFKVVDMRKKKEVIQATIRGSINIPYDEVAGRLDELGCVKNSAKWNCEAAVKMVAFCNGATCSQSPTAIKIMVLEGYPPEKIYYYRGGIQSWILRWLTVTEK